MRVEKRAVHQRGNWPMLCLVPENDNEIQLLKQFIGSERITDDGLVAQLQGEMWKPNGNKSCFIILDKKL